MKHLLAVVIKFSVFLMSASNAIASSGNDLMETCRDYESNPKWGFCVGYIVAVNNIEMAKIKKDFCVPPSVIQSQLARVGVKWMEANPDKLHFSAHSLVAAALAKSFTCTK